MKIDFVDLKRQNKIHKQEFKQAIQQVIDEADFIQGLALEEFEESFAKYCKKRYCIGLNSGTDALLLALLAYGIGPGDEVITAPNSYFSTAMVVEHTGAKVVFADIDPQSYTIDPQQIQKKITSRTRAIMPIHLYGYPADMGSITKLANEYNLIIIEDACQAHGAKYKNELIPITETGAFSFYPGKNLGSFGDGGALVTNNLKVAEKVRLLRNDGSSKKYMHTLFGYKSRLDTLQAAILRVKLSYLDKWNKLRQQHAQVYNQLLKNIPGIIIPQKTIDIFPAYHLYVIQTPKRDALQKFLFEKGISTVIHYPIPIHLQLPYHKQGYKHGDFPITEKVSTRILSLPMFPELKKSEIHYVANQIKHFMMFGKN